MFCVPACAVARATSAAALVPFSSSLAQRCAYLSPLTAPSGTGPAAKAQAPARAAALFVPGAEWSAWCSLPNTPLPPCCPRPAPVEARSAAVEAGAVPGRPSQPSPSQPAASEALGNPGLGDSKQRHELRCSHPHAAHFLSSWPLLGRPSAPPIPFGFWRSRSTRSSRSSSSSGGGVGSTMPALGGHGVSGLAHGHAALVQRGQRGQRSQWGQRGLLALIPSASPHCVPPPRTSLSRFSSFKIVAGRKNRGGGSEPQKPKGWQPKHKQGQRRWKGSGSRGDSGMQWREEQHAQPGMSTLLSPGGGGHLPAQLGEDGLVYRGQPYGVTGVDNVRLHPTQPDEVGVARAYRVSGVDLAHLKTSEAVGQVVSKEANFVRVVVTNCCDDVLGNKVSDTSTSLQDPHPASTPVNGAQSCFQGEKESKEVGSRGVESSAGVAGLEKRGEREEARQQNGCLMGSPQPRPTQDGDADKGSAVGGPLPEPGQGQGWQQGIQESRTKGGAAGCVGAGGDAGGAPVVAGPKRGVELLCVVRALLKKLQRRVLVGDRVVLTSVDWADERGVVHDVLPRRSQVRDPPIANIDHLVVLFALACPRPDQANLSRFLVAAEATGVSVSVVLNKADLVSAEEKDKWRQTLGVWGYGAPLFISVQQRRGMDPLRKRLQGRVSAVVGPSGVGKSSFINSLRFPGTPAHSNSPAGLSPAMHEAQHSGTPRVAHVGPPSGQQLEDERWKEGSGSPSERLQGEGLTLVSEWEQAPPELPAATGKSSDGAVRQLQLKASAVEEPGAESEQHGGALQRDVRALRVGDVSARTGRGRHTTRHVSLVRLPGEQGLLADSPGFNQPSLIDISSSDLPFCFPEIRMRLHQAETTCAFLDCRHISEPGCVIGSDWPRFSHYCSLLQEIRAREEEELRMMGTKRETHVRLKSKGYGEVYEEPMLDPKKHRRESRRRAKQGLIGELEELQEFGEIVQR